MIELRRDDIQEEAEFEGIDLEDESLGISEAFLTLREADSADRVRFEQIPEESSRSPVSIQRTHSIFITSGA